MKTRVILGITGWIIAVILGVIHFLNRDHLYILYTGVKGVIFNGLFFISLTLVVFSNPNQHYKNKDKHRNRKDK